MLERCGRDPVALCPERTARRTLPEAGAAVLCGGFLSPSDPGHLRVYTDSDWGGDHVSRKSASGGICWGEHGFRRLSSTSGSIALSSAEADLLCSGRWCTSGNLGTLF